LEKFAVVFFYLSDHRFTLSQQYTGVSGEIVNILGGGTMDYSE